MVIKKVAKKLDKTLLVLVALVLVALAATLWIGGWQLAISGLKQAGQLINMVWLRLLLGLLLGGLIQVLVPRAIIAKWLGPSSGLKGILIGSYTGIMMSGGPYVFLPIVASIYQAGAGTGPIIALLTGRALLGIEMLIVWQIPFLGVEIPLARYIACLFIPPLVGLAGRAIFQAITMTPQRSGQNERGVGNAEQPRDGINKTGITSEEGG